MDNLTQGKIQDLECVGCQLEQERNKLWRRQPAGIIYKGNSLCPIHFRAVLGGDKKLAEALAKPLPGQPH
ncbi:MAG: hypothetical protein KGJ13_02315 [Patescibacteria group bacterium]|nr:hypothetical protein [Patescibacteria group bacterium]